MSSGIFKQLVVLVLQSNRTAVRQQLDAVYEVEGGMYTDGSTRYAFLITVPSEVKESEVQDAVWCNPSLRSISVEVRAPRKGEVEE